MPKFKLSRRTMLRGMVGGTAVAVGLPPLEAMFNANGTAHADGTGLPIRFMTWCFGDGVRLGQFEPAQTGPNWELSPQLAPLAPVKDYVSVCTGLLNRCENRITHHEGMTAFNGYTFVPLGGQGFNSDPGGPTIDQVIADAIGPQTPVRAVHVGISKVDSEVDGGTTMQNLSHRGVPGNLVPQPPQRNPQQVWQQLFGEFVPQPDDRDMRQSILDFVRDDAKRIEGRLGMLDRQRLDAHLEGVFELEQKILAAPPSCDLPDLPTETNQNVGGVEPITSVNLAMAELLAYAFVCDITRVATCMFKSGAGEAYFDEIGTGWSHHAASHSNSGGGVTAHHNGVVYVMEKFSEMLQVFQNTEDFGGENLLDTMIVYASSDSSNYNHRIERQPIVLAGHGRGHLVHPGIHYQTEPWNGSNGGSINSSGNMSDVLLTCLRCFDPEAPSVGGGAPMSTTPLTEIMA
jgi:hypothetical protein